MQQRANDVVLSVFHFLFGVPDSSVSAPWPKINIRSFAYELRKQHDQLGRAQAASRDVME